MNEHHSDHIVSRIVLPDGSTIEVVRFEEPAGERRALHVCPRCNSDLVQPLAWADAGEGKWELTLECPNCWRVEEGVFDRDQVHELEEQLDDGLTRLLCDLKRLSRANMSEQIDRFVAALNDNQVLPEDF